MYYPTGHRKYLTVLQKWDSAAFIVVLPRTLRLSVLKLYVSENPNGYRERTNLVSSFY